MKDEREAFENKHPRPDGVCWDGLDHCYYPTYPHNWADRAANSYQDRWEGWKSKAEESKQVLDAFMDLIEDLSAKDLSEITELPTERCDEIIALYYELSQEG